MTFFWWLRRGHIDSSALLVLQARSAGRPRDRADCVGRESAGFFTGRLAGGAALLRQGGTTLKTPAGGLFRMITASGLVCLLLVAGAPAPAAEESCQGWKTAKFFESATLQQVRACLSAGRGPNEVDRQGLTALHRAARETSDPAVIEALLDAGANPRASSRAGRLPRHYARTNDKIKGSDPYQRLMIVTVRKSKKADWSRVQAVPHHRKTVVRLYEDAAPRENRRIKGPLPLGHGRLHHPGARERANAHRGQAGRAQGSHPPPVQETVAGMGRPGGWRCASRDPPCSSGRRCSNAKTGPRILHSPNRSRIFLRLADERDLLRATQTPDAAARRRAAR